MSSGSIESVAQDSLDSGSSEKLNQSTNTETLNLFEKTLDQALDLVYWLNEDGDIVYANKITFSKLGFTPEELIGQSMNDIDTGDGFTRWQSLQIDSSDAELVRCESEHRTRTGVLFPVEITFNQIQHDGSVYTSLFVHDISERLKAKAALNHLHDKVEQKVAERTAALQEEIEGRERIETAILNETEKLQTILDNAGQGFLTFGSDLKVQVEYSEECRKIFGGEIWGMNFPTLVANGNAKTEEFLESIFGDLFKESDSGLRKIFFSLIPTDFKVGGKFVRATYKDLTGTDEADSVHLMVVLTDVTETIHLKNRIEADRNILKMVVKAVTNHADLVETIGEYNDFCKNGLTAILGSNNELDDILYQVCRHIHTFKGTFGQLDLIHIVAHLHKLETELLALRSIPEGSTVDDLRKLISDKGLEGWIEEDLFILTKILGRDYFNREEGLVVSPAQIQEIERKMLSALTASQNKQLLPQLRRLRYRPFKSLLNGYTEYVSQLSARLQRPMHPLLVEGSDIEVDPNYYRDFTRSLVHIFRNAVDHGIETEDERLEADKPEQGRVRCSISHNDQNIRMTISDDGRGIDPDKVKRTAVEKGLIDQKTADSLTTTEALDLVFRDGLTTRTESNDLSGRGIGLAAVKQELEKIGGKVVIKTALGKGTSWNFAIPMARTMNFPHIDIGDVMHSLLSRTVEIVSEELQVPVKKVGEVKVGTGINIPVHGATALISIRGLLTGMLALVCEEELAKHLAQQFALGEIETGELDDYIEDTMAELANIVLGNTLNIFPEANNLVTIATPVTVRHGAKQHISFTGRDVWTSKLETELGNLTISLLISDTLS